MSSIAGVTDNIDSSIQYRIAINTSWNRTGAKTYTVTKVQGAAVSAIVDCCVKFPGGASLEARDFADYSIVVNNITAHPTATYSLTTNTLTLRSPA